MKNQDQIPAPQVEIVNGGTFDFLVQKGQDQIFICGFNKEGEAVTEAFFGPLIGPAGTHSQPVKITGMAWKKQRIPGEKYVFKTVATNNDGDVKSPEVQVEWIATKNGNGDTNPTPPAPAPAPAPVPPVPAPAPVPPVPAPAPSPAPAPAPADPGAVNAATFQRELAPLRTQIERAFDALKLGTAPTRHQVDALDADARDLDKAIKANVRIFPGSTAIADCNVQITGLMIRIDDLKMHIPSPAPAPSPAPRPAPAPRPTPVPPAPAPAPAPIPAPAPAPAPAPRPAPAPAPAPAPRPTPVPPVPAPAPAPAPAPSPAPVPPAPAPAPVHIVTLGGGDGESNNYKLALVLGIIALIMLAVGMFFYVSRNQTLDADRTDAAGTKAQAMAEIEAARRLQVETMDKMHKLGDEIEGMRRAQHVTPLKPESPAPTPIPPAPVVQPTTSVTTNVVEQVTQVIQRRQVVVVEPEVVVVKAPPTIVQTEREHVSAYETTYWSPTPMMDRYGYDKQGFDGFRYPPSRRQ